MACSRRPVRRSRSSICLRKEIAAVLAQPDFREKLANTGSGEPYTVDAG